MEFGKFADGKSPFVAHIYEGKSKQFGELLQSVFLKGLLRLCPPVFCPLAPTTQLPRPTHPNMTKPNTAAYNNISVTK